MLVLVLVLVLMHQMLRAGIRMAGVKLGRLICGYESSRIHHAADAGSRRTLIIDIREAVAVVILYRGIVHPRTHDGQRSVDGLMGGKKESIWEETRAVGCEPISLER